MADLSRGRGLDVGAIGVTPAEYPLLPDAALTNPEAGWLDPRAWFPHPAHPFEIEIGTGKGAFIINESDARRDTNFLGIEWEGEIYAYCADRLRRRQAANVRMLHTNAVDMFRWRIPDEIVHVVHLYFSDPWPKPKHHKNRVIQHAFLAQVWRVLVPGGELRVVTDHDELWAWCESHFAEWTVAGSASVPANILARSSGAPFSRQDFVSPSWVASGAVLGTNFEIKFQREDRPAHSGGLKKAESVQTE